MATSLLKCSSTLCNSRAIETGGSNSNFAVFSTLGNSSTSVNPVVLTKPSDILNACYVYTSVKLLTVFGKHFVVKLYSNSCWDTYTLDYDITFLLVPGNTPSTVHVLPVPITSLLTEPLQKQMYPEHDMEAGEGWSYGRTGQSGQLHATVTLSQGKALQVAVI